MYSIVRYPYYFIAYLSLIYFRHKMKSAAEFKPQLSRLCVNQGPNDRMSNRLDDFIFNIKQYSSAVCRAMPKTASYRALFAQELIQRFALTQQSVSTRELHETRTTLWENLHHVHWKDTCDLDRETFCILTAILVYNIISVRTFPEIDYKSLARALDIGLLMGSKHTSQIVLPLIDHVQSVLCTNCSAFVHRIESKLQLSQQEDAQFRMKTFGEHNDIASHVQNIDVENSPSVLDFHLKYFSRQRPVVLTNCMADWPAIQAAEEDSSGSSSRWACLSYLLPILGQRTVPVETGKSYLSKDAGSTFMTGQAFVEKYLLGRTCGDAAEADVCLTPSVASTGNLSVAVDPSFSSPAPLPGTVSVGYLAQHQLLDQVPRLREDIVVPDYCALLLDADEEETEGEGEGEGERDGDPDDVKLQAWLGPVGTVSPLHHDPYYNLLAQVTGYKYIRIYDPADSLCLYPMRGRMSNNSCVDLLEDAATLLAKFPKLFSAPYLEYVLGPGEMLFLPRWWWHFIVAIDRDTALRWRAEYLVQSGENGRRERKETSGVGGPQGGSGDLAGGAHLGVLGKRQLRDRDFEYQDEGKDGMKVSSHDGDTEVDFSFSVSFWWGARKLSKP